LGFKENGLHDAGSLIGDLGFGIFDFSVFVTIFIFIYILITDCFASSCEFKLPARESVTNFFNTYHKNKTRSATRNPNHASLGAQFNQSAIRYPKSKIERPAPRNAQHASRKCLRVCADNSAWILSFQS